MTYLMSIGNSQISDFSFSFMFAAKIISYHHWSKVKKKKVKTSGKAISFHYQSDYEILC